MKRFSLILVLTALVAAGCGRSSTEETPLLDVTQAVHGIVLCGDCGQVKGTDLCCADGAEACEKCGLQSGAPGCCKMEQGTNVTLCSSCGQIKGVEICCLEGATVCANCGWHKGSPACCKIEKPAAEDSGSDLKGDSVPASGNKEDADEDSVDAPATDAS